MNRKVCRTEDLREGYDHMPLKAVYIGDDHTWTVMREQIQPDWDWQSPIPRIDEVFDEIVTSFTVDIRHGSAGKEELDG